MWAEENTRESIFNAMKRRESFATSGGCIRVRFFGGWNYPTDLNKRRDLVEIGYKNGVPMGGESSLEARQCKITPVCFVGNQGSGRR